MGNSKKKHSQNKPGNNSNTPTTKSPVSNKTKTTTIKEEEPVGLFDDVDFNEDTRHGIIWLSVVILLGALAGKLAYQVRLHALDTYGLLIHEFDPWFNYRATEYLLDNGVKKFFEWFDYESWYPLGRPVGSTIYPGMQFSSVGIYFLLKKIGMPMSLNDICCYVPAWFGVSASFFTGMLAYECSRSKIAGAVAMLVMAIIPAHIMRSVGGGYDNESVAVTAMTMTFYLWVRSVRYKTSWPFAFLAALSYTYMAAAWGGYVFVINMIGVHAAYLAIFNFTPKVFWSYMIFFFFGTLGAVQVPVVSYTPLRSLEQMGPMLVFLGYPLLYYCEIQRQKKNLNIYQLWSLRIQVGLVAAAVLAVVVVGVLMPLGYFGDVTARVKGLFVKHTKTGNPLVDSVAEHQPASADAYFQYLHSSIYFAPIGFTLISMWGRKDSASFLLIYAVLSYYFSARMVRLIIFLGPIVSCLTGAAVGYFLEWSYDQFTVEEPTDKDGDKKKSVINQALGPFQSIYEKGLGARRIFSLVTSYIIVHLAFGFYSYCSEMAVRFSNPTVVFKAQLRSGETIIVDDYLDSYKWLKKNTPEDARVMAWWDYGYQINGIANRTSIADGNTWNHEHIATLARCLISPEKDAHRMIRHLADYVLVWAGGGGDDLAKMPHIARIGTSVYNSLCPNDPNCRQLGFIDRQQTPSPMLAESLLYKLHSHNGQSVKADPNRFEEVYKTKYGKVRIWKVKGVDLKSKEWNANPKNRICDQPGSWICRGQYPPGMQKFVKEMKRYS